MSRRFRAIPQMPIRLRSNDAMKMYYKKFHSGHLYLDIEDCEIDTIRPSLFEELMDRSGKPLQVSVSSSRAQLVGLLKQSGFELKRRCYDMHVLTSDLVVPLPAKPQSLPMAHIGTAAYDSCVEKMYQYYRDTHSTVNPLTCTQEEFSEILPQTAAYSKFKNKIDSAAFIEENEIAYLCSSSESGFLEFARSLISDLFDRYDSIVFEADDTDWAAMRLKAFFAQKDDVSFDTYVKRYANECGEPS